MIFLKLMFFILLSFSGFLWNMCPAEELSLRDAASEVKLIQQGDTPHKSEVLGLLDKAFVERNVAYLDQISDVKFRRSDFYKKLQNYVTSKKLNLNHIVETATQEFLVSNDGSLVLFVDFDKREDNKWYVADAYQTKYSFKGEQKQEERIELDTQGFEPLEYESNFSSFFNIFEKSDVSGYYGLAPHGKLSTKFVKASRGIQLSRNKVIKLKNIIIYDDNKIDDMIFLVLRNYPVGHRGDELNTPYQSGWRFESGGSMSELYKQGQDVYVDFLLKRDPTLLKLSEPNKKIGVARLDRLPSPSQRTSQQNQVESNSIKITIPEPNTQTNAATPAVPTTGNIITEVICEHVTEGFKMVVVFLREVGSDVSLLNEDNFKHGEKTVLMFSNKDFSKFLKLPHICSNNKLLTARKKGELGLEIDFSSVAPSTSQVEHYISEKHLYIFLKRSQ